MALPPILPLVLPSIDRLLLKTFEKPSKTKNYPLYQSDGAPSLHLSLNYSRLLGELTFCIHLSLHSNKKEDEG